MRAVLMPHAPVLAPALAARWEVELSAITSAMTTSGAIDGDTLIVSPHGARAGVYDAPQGSLASMGLPEVNHVAPSAADLRGALSRAWDRPRLRTPTDHGVLVPMLYLGERSRVAALALPECSGPDAATVSDAIEETRSLAGVIAGIDATIVFSAHSSAALSPAAPLTRKEEGLVLHREVKSALASDVSALADIPASRWEAGGCCSAAVLTLMGMVTSGPARVHASAEPFGIGYVVAECP